MVTSVVSRKYFISSFITDKMRCISCIYATQTVLTSNFDAPVQINISLLDLILSIIPLYVLARRMTLIQQSHPDVLLMQIDGQLCTSDQ